MGQAPQANKNTRVSMCKIQILTKNWQERSLEMLLELLILWRKIIRLTWLRLKVNVFSPCSAKMSWILMISRLLLRASLRFSWLRSVLRMEHGFSFLPSNSLPSGTRLARSSSICIKRGELSILSDSSLISKVTHYKKSQSHSCLITVSNST